MLYPPELRAQSIESTLYTLCWILQRGDCDNSIFPSRVKGRHGQPQPCRHASDRVTVHHLATRAVHQEFRCRFRIARLAVHLRGERMPEIIGPRDGGVLAQHRLAGPRPAFQHTTVRECPPTPELGKRPQGLDAFSRQRQGPPLCPRALLPGWDCHRVGPPVDGLWRELLDERMRQARVGNDGQPCLRLGVWSSRSSPFRPCPWSGIAARIFAIVVYGMSLASGSGNFGHQGFADRVRGRLPIQARPEGLQGGSTVPHRGWL